MRPFPVLYVGPALGRDGVHTEAVGINTLRLQAGRGLAHKAAAAQPQALAPEPQLGWRQVKAPGGLRVSADDLRRAKATLGHWVLEVGPQTCKTMGSFLQAMVAQCEGPCGRGG